MTVGLGVWTAIGLTSAPLSAMASSNSSMPKSNAMIGALADSSSLDQFHLTAHSEATAVPKATEGLGKTPGDKRNPGTSPPGRYWGVTSLCGATSASASTNTHYRTSMLAHRPCSRSGAVVSISASACNRPALSSDDFWDFRPADRTDADDYVERVRGTKS